MLQEESTIFSEAWLQAELQELCSSQQVCSFRSTTIFPFLICLGSSAGVKPALAAATFMSGVAGAWSYVKKIV